MAKTKEIPVGDRLQNLFDLQQIDNQLRDILILKGELPNEVSDLEDEIEGLRTRAGKTEDAIEELNDEISKHSANVSDSEAAIKKYEKQLDEVKNNREFEALTKEIAMQKLEIELSEKRSGEAGAKLDGRKQTLEALQERIGQLNDSLELKKTELEDIIKKTEKEEKSHQRKADGMRKKVDDRVLKAYDKIRTTYRNGLAVVTVERDSCGGCFNRVPPQTQLEIRLRKKIIACEHCGRILVDNEIAGIAVEG